jgi:hypothetical protein
MLRDGAAHRQRTVAREEKKGVLRRGLQLLVVQGSGEYITFLPSTRST